MDTLVDSQHKGLIMQKELLDFVWESTAQISCNAEIW